jgi:hypothetical protein
MLGLVLVHNSDYASKCFLKLGYAIRMQELDESEMDPPKGTAITYRSIQDYAKQLKTTWHAAISIIDLVDVTDFYLLLFENDLYNPEASENMEGQAFIDNLVQQRTAQRKQNYSGMSDWEMIRAFWFVAFFASMFGSIMDKVLLAFMAKIKKSSWARWSELPDGMTFWGLYAAKRQMERKKMEQKGESTTGPYPEAWRAATEYYAFNLPRKKNQQAFISAVRSVLFVEAPFIYWRLLCSEKYGIVASSLMIKNAVSLVYDAYIAIWGLWRLYLMIWCRQLELPCADRYHKRLEDEEIANGKMPTKKKLTRTRSVRIMGAKSWLTTEQLMSQSVNEQAHSAYLKTGVVASYLYSSELYGDNIVQVEDDEVVGFLESTGMAA